MSAAASLDAAQAVSVDRLAEYRQMVRPRILLMSAVAVAAGFILSSTELVDWLLLAIAAPSICLLVAASSVLNQVIEADSDYRMARTTARPLASGRISRREGLLLGSAFAVLGSVLLWTLVNPLTSAASLLTMLCYVCAYTPLKRRSEFCTTIGAIPGAMPPVLGWLAAGGQPGIECLALFALFFVWQFPHFLAIGWIYRQQYSDAGLKMLPSFTDGGRLTGLLAMLYAVAFVPVACLPRFVGLAGSGYLAAALVLSTGYLWLTIRFAFTRSDFRARRLLAGSLICLPVLLVCLVFDFLRLTI
ncbi:MAG: Protoheme farnesyltransferase 1 [Planctomycetota bacterium]|jgi:protoheme IX farnesyltransferase